MTGTHEGNLYERFGYGVVDDAAGNVNAWVSNVLQNGYWSFVFFWGMGGGGVPVISYELITVQAIFKLILVIQMEFNVSLPVHL